MPSLWFITALTISMSSAAYPQSDPIEQLIRNLTSADYEISHRAMEALAQTKDQEILERLITLMQNDNDELMRSRAAKILGDIKNATAVKALINTLKDEEETDLVRTAAAEALGSIGDSRAVKPLIAALGGHNWSVCCSAADALGQVGDRRAVSPLIEALAAQYSWKGFVSPYQDPDQAVRRCVIEALGRIKDPRAIEAR
jgi:HEAT repeat protein